MTPRVDEVCYRDAYVRSLGARVLEVSAADGPPLVVLDVTAFYPGGGGQPSDRGTILRAVDGRTWTVRAARRLGGEIVHELEAPDDGELPRAGDPVTVDLEWARRYALMRTHTALHALCGVVWRDYGALVTGGNMEPLSARMDFDLPDVPADFKSRIAEACAREVAADRRIDVRVLPREAAFAIPDIIRTATDLLPPDLIDVRIVDIVGLDTQADGGTHVASTRQIGGIEVVKVENKGKANRRLRVRLRD